MIITPIPIAPNQPPPISNNQLMSSENTNPSPPPPSGPRKPAPSRTQPPEQQQQQPPPLKCPRCDSANTKFCYYNNYSLSQPRHFCKTCRRYWTKGGALRNVPIGGACRRTKKIKPGPNPVVSDFGSAGFKFLSPPITANTTNTAVDFQLGGLSLPRLHPATAGVYTQFVTGAPVGVFGLDLSGLNYPNSTSGSNPDQGQNINNISISSIESLSSINQEMHWKLQQQRLASIYGNPTDDGVHNHHHQKSQTENSPMIAMNLFQNNNDNNNYNGIENEGVNINWGNLQQEFNGLQ